MRAPSPEGSPTRSALSRTARRPVRHGLRRTPDRGDHRDPAPEQVDVVADGGSDVLDRLPVDLFAGQVDVSVPGDRPGVHEVELQVAVAVRGDPVEHPAEVVGHLRVRRVERVVVRPPVVPGDERTAVVTRDEQVGALGGDRRAGQGDQRREPDARTEAVARDGPCGRRHPAREVGPRRPVADDGLPPVVQLEDVDRVALEVGGRPRDPVLGDVLVVRVPAAPHGAGAGRPATEPLGDPVGVRGEDVLLGAVRDEPLRVVLLARRPQDVAVGADPRVPSPSAPTRRVPPSGPVTAPTALPECACGVSFAASSAVSRRSGLSLIPMVSPSTRVHPLGLHEFQPCR